MRGIEALVATALLTTACSSTDGSPTPTEEPDYNNRVVISQDIRLSLASGLSKESMTCWTDEPVEVKVSNDAMFHVIFDSAYCPIPLVESNLQEEKQARKKVLRVREASGLQGRAGYIPSVNMITPYIPGVTSQE